jgi:hypothetical protein
MDLWHKLLSELNFLKYLDWGPIIHKVMKWFIIDT